MAASAMAATGSLPREYRRCEWRCIKAEQGCRGEAGGDAEAAAGGEKRQRRERGGKKKGGNQRAEEWAAKRGR